MAIQVTSRYDVSSCLTWSLMEILTFSDGDILDTADRVARALEDGGIVCFPCNGAYRLAVDFTDEAAVMSLLQSKRKVKRAPALVFVADLEHAQEIANVDEQGKKLAGAFWPGDLTILFEPKELSRKLVKQITTKSGKLGLRVPNDPLTQQILNRAKVPLLISSANRERKGGETSPAQVKKNFGNAMALFVDNGDLSGGSKSTVVDPLDADFTVTREGLLSESDIRSGLA